MQVSVHFNNSLHFSNKKTCCDVCIDSKPFVWHVKRAKTKPSKLNAPLQIINFFFLYVRLRFLHYSVDDEDYYRRFGKFPANTEFDLESLPPGRLNGPTHVSNAIDPYAYGGQYSCTTAPEKRWQPPLPPPPPPTHHQHQNHMYRSSYSTQFDQPQQTMPMRHSVDYGSASVHRRLPPPQDYQMRETSDVDQYGANQTNGLEQPIVNYRNPVIQQQQQQRTDKDIAVTGTEKVVDRVERG